MGSEVYLSGKGWFVAYYYSEEYDRPDTWELWAVPSLNEKFKLLRTYSTAPSYNTANADYLTLTNKGD